MLIEALNSAYPGLNMKPGVFVSQVKPDGEATHIQFEWEE